MKSIIIVTALSAVFCASCSISRKHSSRSIVYTTFPALDTMLNAIVKAEQKDNLYTLAFLTMEDREKYIFSIYILGTDRLSKIDSLAYRSNRYINVLGNLIPLYLDGYDNSFSPFPKGTLPEFDRVWDGINIKFNMAQKEIIEIRNRDKKYVPIR